MGGGGRGRSVANRVVRGSMSAVNISFPPEDVGDHDDFEEEDDNGSQLVLYLDDILDQKRLECRKLRLGIPAYIDFLREMFHGVTVDGRPSCIPGEASLPLPVDANADEDDEYADGNANGNFDSPMSTSSRRRASSTIDIASSPPRKNKSP
uniref:Uncharacterized protein n=1 Tax=Setaria viridis TaxID=4556 RepID=A0A4U6VJN5_SETVI|nr:hypothetical protein SEVIR_3G277233v2 [Setaria viridis]